VPPRRALARQDAAVVTTLRQAGPLGSLLLGFLLVLAATVPFPRCRGRLAGIWLAAPGVQAVPTLYSRGTKIFRLRAASRTQRR
jgi:hypothetical protein